MHDKFKRAHRTPRADDRLRRQIAEEAARRLVARRHAQLLAALAVEAEARGEDPPPVDPIALADPRWVDDLDEPELYTAKRKAAAVLGHRVRPGDLPADSEVRLRAVALVRSGATVPAGVERDDPAPPEPDDGEAPRLADHLDRFAVYALRLAPLEAVKGDPARHPEGDALYHSLQAFERAREARPLDEEFLVAALLHDVGKAIRPGDHVAAGVEALRGSISERTLRLIARHHDLDDPRSKPKTRPPGETDDERDDLALLRECDLAARVPGRPVEGVEAAIAYLRGLEAESYLES